MNKQQFNYADEPATFLGASTTKRVEWRVPNK